MKPVNRHEAFLDALANGVVPDIEPSNREEAFLAKIAERVANSGGGSNDSVAPYTFTATQSQTGWAHHSDFDKIVECFNAGVPCTMVAGTRMYRLTSVSNNTATFLSGAYYDTTMNIWYAVIERDREYCSELKAME